MSFFARGMRDADLYGRSAAPNVYKYTRRKRRCSAVSGG